MLSSARNRQADQYIDSSAASHHSLLSKKAADRFLFSGYHLEHHLDETLSM